ncbi:hypothetical protein FHQ18_10815 [Deferribacter autotrophicus]|uniref:DUF5320 domain-containing protein n=1 Tax=Deferribacter autotrophicus TaxID=500465 RepID=A0A5A8EZT5_9BACT|nr:DUF5320 domain-containing protein [Deferribacter autotrophicus]KAA0257052.1 hypothetical protein FHQ18_10815 [Deferribacter autotrophicus]
MPGFDRTGPIGEGPRTGRGLGRCNGNVENRENTNAEYPVRRRLRDGSCHNGRGQGLGRGYGRGFGCRRG